MVLSGCQDRGIYRLSVDNEANYKARSRHPSSCYAHTVQGYIYYHCLIFEIHMIWSILLKISEQKIAKKKKSKPPLHIQICIMQCWHLRVLDLKAFKWTWLWCKNIITQFCQAHRHKHMHQHAHRRPPCKLNMHRASTALTIWFITAAKHVSEDRSSHKYAAEYSWKPSPCCRNQMWWD